MNEQTTLLPQEGDKIGAGIVLCLISAGGTTHVYKTWVESLELHRAVKVMNPDAGPEVRARFATEARISSKLVHHNIVHVYNFGETSTGLPYIEMELVSGLTLESVLRQRDELPLPVALAVAMGILEALHYAHTITFTLYDQPLRGVMHRDIKPANVIFSGGVPKLMDFGIARPVTVSLHTMAGGTPGTMSYIPPEVYIGGSSDFRSDVYQVGLLLYECISGRMAYPQTELGPLIDAIKTGTRRQLDTNSRAAAIVKKCLELEPDDRYQTAHECLADIRDLYDGLSSHVPPENRIQSFFQGGAEDDDMELSVKRKKKAAVNPKTRKIAIIAAVCAAAVTLLGTIIAALAPMVLRSMINEYAQSQTSAQDTQDTSAKSDASLSAVTAVTAQDTLGKQSPPPPAKQIMPPPAKQIMPPPAKQSPPSSAKQSSPPPAKQTVKPLPPQQASAPSSDDALFFIDQGKKLLAQNKPQDALISFQRALRTPSESIQKQEIIKQSLYGTARANSILYRQGSVPRANYERAWRAVQGVFPAGSTEYEEAVERLEQ